MNDSALLAHFNIRPRHPDRCAVHASEVCHPEDEFVPCGKPAHWRVESDDESYLVCESHCVEVLLWTKATVTSELTGNPVCLDEAGEVVAA